jgi:hypothetical protein
MPIDLEKIQVSITKTGFELEYKIGNLLRQNGWHLISNRCYIDDLEGTVREIDLLAYKVSSVKDFLVYTVIIISCKKNESNAWALLSRPIEEKDPNYNWRPFKGWSNHPALKYYMGSKSWPISYHEKLSDECPSLFEAPAVDVFAFQEMSKANGTSQNDKNIFASITSLMKAQSYEMSILENRQKEKKRVYQFNLISLIDSELVRVFFDEEKITATLVDSEDYLCRYILNKSEEIARIKFVSANAFPGMLEEYSKLHAKNLDVFAVNHEKFYSDAYKTWAKSKLLIEDLRKALRTPLTQARYKYDKRYVEFTDVGTFWHTAEQRLIIELEHESITGEMIASLNQDADLKATTATALSDIYHYVGEFAFDEGIIF